MGSPKHQLLSICGYKILYAMWQATLAIFKKHFSLHFVSFPGNFN